MKEKVFKVLKYLIPSLLCAIITIVILAARHSFVKSGKSLMIDLCDAFSVSGGILLCYGILVLLTNGGAFDMFAFGFIRFGELFKRDLSQKKYDTYYEYRESRQEKKRSFWHFILIGGAFLIVGIIFLIVYSKM